MERADERSDRTIKKRAVCYIPGYDPRGPKFYHRMFKRESRKQAKISGYELEVDKLNVTNERVAKWEIKHVDQEGQITETDYHYFNYDDLIKAKWEKSTAGIYFTTLGGIWTFLVNGIFISGWRSRWQSMVTICIPMIMLFLQLLVLAISGFFLFRESGPSWTIGVPVFTLIIGLVYWLGLKIDKKYSYHWLTRTYKFLIYQRYPKLAQIREAFKTQLLAIDRSDEYDEITVVGHSMGTILAVELMHEGLQADDQFTKRRAEINLLTLGSPIGLISSVHENKSLHEALYHLKDETRIDWLDFSAKADGANIFLKHPLCMTKGWVKQKHPLPRLFPARFFKCFSPEGYKKLRNDKLRLHFQYVLSMEQSGEYDYFKMVTDTNFLRDSFPQPAKS